MLREALLDSERYAHLHSDTARLAFVHLLLLADDVGNLEATSHRLLRRLYPASIATDEVLSKVLDDLASADLIRVYEIDGRRFIHIPRFGQRLRHITRRCPGSPWDDLIAIEKVAEKTAGVRRARVRRTTAEPKTTEAKASVLPTVVGVVNHLPPSKGAREAGSRRQIADKSKPAPFIDRWWDDEQKTKLMADAIGVPSLPQESWADWRHRIFDAIKRLKT
jgi:hypothetical protein